MVLNLAHFPIPLICKRKCKGKKQANNFRNPIPKFTFMKMWI